MRIGYYVQGAMDESVVRGLAKRWCPDAELAEGRFRGRSKESFWREIRKSLMELKDDKECDLLVVLTDADVNPWRMVKQRESSRVPDDCKHMTLFGAADRNIECWLAVDRSALAEELDCRMEDVPVLPEDPSGFVKGEFERRARNRGQDARECVSGYVERALLKPWIEGSDSFEDFYEDVRRLALRTGCSFPNERESGRRR